MKKIVLTSLALIFSAMIYAQQTGPAISWTAETHDFGTISEDAGQQDWTFEFVNTGNEPLEIKAVKPSCGCTSTDYSKELIAPGAKGFVKASYNPKGRGFGNFNKSITVTTNEAQPNSYLRISGNVFNPNPTPTTNPVAQPEERFDRTIQPAQPGKATVTPAEQPQLQQSAPASREIRRANVEEKPVERAKDVQQGQRINRPVETK